MITRPPTSPLPRTPPGPRAVRAADAGAPPLDRLIDHVRRLMPVDGVALLVVDERRTWLEPAADWYANDDLRQAIEPAHRRRYDRRLPGLAELTIERDRPLLLPRVEAWEASADLREHARLSLGDQAAERFWRHLRSASVACCAIKPGLGRALGVVEVASLDPARPLGRRDLHAVQLVAESAALLLERSKLLAVEARRAREELLLKRAAEAVSASLEPEEVYASIVDHAVRLTGAPKALLTRLQPSTGELVTAARIGFTEEASAGRYSLEGSMLGRVARSREPYLSRADDADRWDRRIVASEGLASFIHVPIELGPRLFGVLTVADAAPDRFDRDDLELIGKLARISAAGLANAIDFERERRLARALTLGFVPESLPEVPGYEVGLIYEPAANQPVGGDVYGAWPVHGGEMAVLLGDVAGKGVETAALSSMVRFFLEARAWDEHDPALVLAQANEMLRNRLPSETFVTAFLGFLSADGLRYANAGHLPPLLVSPAGQVTELGERGLPLGVDEAPSYSAGALTLGPGDLVFGYTDGLVEPRRKGEMYGYERLRALLSARAAAMTPAELVRAAHADVAEWAEGLTDDTVALALRRRG